MRTCEEYEALLSALLDGRLDSEEQRVVEEHLAVCPACRAYLADQRQIAEVLRELDASAPEGFTEDVMARVRAEGRQLGRKTVRLHGRRWVAAAACVTLAAAGLWWCWREPLADRTAMMRGVGPDAGLYSTEGLDPCSLENGIALPLPHGAEEYAAVLTTASETAGAWVEEHLDAAWVSGGTYALTAEEYAALRQTLTAAGEDFSEMVGPTGAEGYLLKAQ